MEDNNIMVNFQTPELGVEKVPDFGLIAASERDPMMDHGRGDLLDSDLEEGTQILQGLDHFSMALLVKLLERKTHLVSEMRKFNDIAEKQQLQGLKPGFFEDLGWIGANIEAIEEVVRPVSTKFRLRGLEAESSAGVSLDGPKLEKNFMGLLNVFRENLERQIDSSRDYEQKEELAEVRSFLNQSLNVGQA